MHQRILVIRTDRMGDVVLTTPAIRTLRQACPAARITILVSPHTKPLLIGNPDINEILVDDRQNQHKGFTGFLKLVGELRKRDFDAVIVFHTKRRTLWLSAISGIPHRYGYRSKKAGNLLNHALPDVRVTSGRHETDLCRDVLKSLNITPTESPMFVSVDPDAEHWVEQFLTQNSQGSGEKLIAIHVGASDPSKCWPIEYFSQVVKELRQKGNIRFILIGEAALRRRVQPLLEEHGTDMMDLTGLTTVSQLVSLLKRCHLLISNDSGPVHVAAALETPVVSIFTRNQPGINPQRWRPLGAGSTWVSVDADADADFRKAGSADESYLRKISPRQVLEAVDAVFKL